MLDLVLEKSLKLLFCKTDVNDDDDDDDNSTHLRLAVTMFSIVCTT